MFIKIRKSNVLGESVNCEFISEEVFFKVTNNMIKKQKDDKLICFEDEEFIWLNILGEK